MSKKKQLKSSKQAKTGTKRTKVLSSTSTYVVEMVSDALEISAAKIRPRVTPIINKAVNEKTLNTQNVAKEVAFEVYQHIGASLEFIENVPAMMTRSRRTVKQLKNKNYFSSLLQMYIKLHNTKESIFFQNLIIMLLNLVPYNKMSQFCSFLIIHKGDVDIEDFVKFLNFIINTTCFEYDFLLVKYFKFIFQTAKEYYFSEKNLLKLYNLQTFFYVVNMNPRLTLHVLNYSVRLLVYCVPTVNKICATFIGELIMSSSYAFSSTTTREETFKDKEYIKETISYINNTLKFLEVLKQYYYPVFIIFLKQFAYVVKGNENPEIHPIIFTITSMLTSLFNKEVKQMGFPALQTQNVKEKIIDANMNKAPNSSCNNSPFPFSHGSYFDKMFEPLNRQHCSTIREKGRNKDYTEALEKEYNSAFKHYEEMDKKVQFLRINRKHVETICNFCSCRIKSIFRYRCVSCVNYDLCELCFEYLHNDSEFTLNPSQPICKPPTDNSFICPYCEENIKWDNLTVSVSTHFYNHISECMKTFDDDAITEARFECPVCAYEEIYEENESGWFTPKLVRRHFQKYHSVSLEGTPEFHRVFLIRVPSYQNINSKTGMGSIDEKLTKYITEKGRAKFEQTQNCSSCERVLEDKFYKCLNCNNTVLLCAKCANLKPHGINVVNFANNKLNVHNPLHLLVYIESKEPEKQSCSEFIRHSSHYSTRPPGQPSNLPYIPYDPEIEENSTEEEGELFGENEDQNINENDGEEIDVEEELEVSEENLTPEQLDLLLKDICSSSCLYREEMVKTTDILTSSALLFNQITSLLISTYIGYTYPLIDTVNKKHPPILRHFIETKVVQFFDVILSQITYLNKQFEIIKQTNLKIITDQVTNKEVLHFISSINQNWCFGICEILCNFHNYAPFVLQTQTHKNFTYELIKEAVILSIHLLSNAGYYINNPHFIKEMLKCISTFEYSPQISNSESVFTESLLQLSNVNKQGEESDNKQPSDIYNTSGDSIEFVGTKKSKTKTQTLSTDDLNAIKLAASVRLKLDILKHPIIKKHFFNAYIKATNYYMEKDPLMEDENFDPIYKRISLFISPMYLLSIINLQNEYNSTMNNNNDDIENGHSLKVNKVIDDYKNLFDLIRHKDDIYAQNISITNPPFCFTEYKIFTLISKNESFRTLADYKLVSNFLLKSAHQMINKNEKGTVNKLYVDTSKDLDLDAETLLLNPDGKLTPRKEFEIMRYLNYSREVLNVAFKNFKDKLKKHHEEIYNKLPLGKENEEVKNKVNILYPSESEQDSSIHTNDSNNDEVAQSRGNYGGTYSQNLRSEFYQRYRDFLGPFDNNNNQEPTISTHRESSDDEYLEINRDEEEEYRRVTNTLNSIVPPDRLRQAARCFCNVLSLFNPLLYLLGNFKVVSELFCNQEISIYYVNTINSFLKKIFEEDNISVWVQIYDYIQANGFHKIEHYLINLPLIVFSILKMIHLFIKNSKEAIRIKFQQELDLELIDNAVTFVSEYKFYMNGDNVYSSKNVEEFEKYMNEEECDMLLSLSSVVMGEIKSGDKIKKEDELKQSREQVEKELKEAKEVPREMLDCITLEKMEVPILIRGQRVHCDKSTIIKHMLTNKTNPFTGLEMEIDDITVDEELYKKILDSEKHKK